MRQATGGPMPLDPPGWAENGLLAALPPSERGRLLPLTDVVDLSAKQTLHEAGEPIRWLYFPLTAIVSLVSQLADGRLMEVGTIGHEGTVGLSVALGADSTPFRAAVEVKGRARRMAVRVVREEASRGGALKGVLDRYAQAFITQTAQWTACNRLHSVDQRCARWLLLTHDLARADRFPLTHELLALKLGARRPSVTTAARTFQEAGLIRYSRGQITVLDRAGLEAASCECYRIVRAEYERLLG